MDVGMLGLIYCGVRERTVGPEVLGRNISLDAEVLRNVPRFLVAVAWGHGV